MQDQVSAVFENSEDGGDLRFCGDWLHMAFPDVSFWERWKTGLLEGEEVEPK
jgi:hypothetical protein